MTVPDVSAAALEQVEAQVAAQLPGPRGALEVVVADLLEWTPGRSYEL